ncbi:MAG TPA: flagellar motor protein MotD [Porticoccaceae bacterium]|nr:flagellar motor protein MotD [Porticoccaceae bacterium]
MSRRKQETDNNNHERWLVSYADFITLLFAFFVVMYSVSSVNESKFRVLSHSLVSSFKDPTQTLDPLQVSQLSRVGHQLALHQQSIPFTIANPPIQLASISSINNGAIDISHSRNNAATDGREELDIIADNLKDVLDLLADEDQIQLKRNKDSVEIEINSSVLFGSGSSNLASEANTVLSALADTLKHLPNRINVEGFTDNLPIKNQIFPSNWELSAARAATVVRLFSEYGVEPSRMASIGYGEHRPIASNDSTDGRALNRRIAILVLGSPVTTREPGE